MMPANPPPAQLLPCPFCGGEDVADFESITGDTHIACVDCDARGPDCENEAEAIAAWNTRAPSPERGELASLVEALASAFVTCTCGPSGHHVTLTYPDCKAAQNAHDAILEYRKGVRWSIEQSAKTGAVATDAAGDAS